MSCEYLFSELPFNIRSHRDDLSFAAAGKRAQLKIISELRIEVHSIVNQKLQIEDEIKVIKNECESFCNTFEHSVNTNQEMNNFLSVQHYAKMDSFAVKIRALRKRIAEIEEANFIRDHGLVHEGARHQHLNETLQRAKSILFGLKLHLKNLGFQDL